MKLIRWNHNISTDHVHTFTKEYKNGDQAFIFQDNSTWIWEYADSAGKTLKSRAASSVLEAKSQCDDFNLIFPIDWETGT